MSIADRINVLAQTIAGEFRAVRLAAFGGETANAAGLDTSAKNLVGAINEIRQSVVPIVAVATSSTYIVTSSPMTLVCDVSSGPLSITLPNAGRFTLIIAGGDPSINVISLSNGAPVFKGQAGAYVISSNAFSRYDFEYINASYGFSVSRHN